MRVEVTTLACAKTAARTAILLQEDIRNRGTIDHLVTARAVSGDGGCAVIVDMPDGDADVTIQILRELVAVLGDLI